mgnify:CR=1 FL=1
MRPDALTLKQLRAVQAIARHGSLTAAAEAIGLSTPAIHSQIKALEGAVGAPVLTRAESGTGMRLTAIGQEMLRAAQQIEGILSQAARQVGALSAGRTGHVTLSVVSTAKYFAPRLVRILADRCPDIAVTLRVGNRDSVIADLAEARCALAIMGRPPREPLVQAVPLGPHPHGVILPPDHPLAGRHGFDSDLLLRETFLSREPGSGTRMLMYRFLDQIGRDRLPDLLEMESNETIKQAVLAGLGVAFLSLHTVCDELNAGRLAVLRGPGLPVMRHWYLVRPLQMAPGPTAERIATEIEGLAGAFLPIPPIG